MCDCKAKNQTPKESMDALRTMANPDKLVGIGVFLVPDPLAGVLEYQSVIHEDPITYEECAKRGFNWGSRQETDKIVR